MVRKIIPWTQKTMQSFFLPPNQPSTSNQTMIRRTTSQDPESDNASINGEDRSPQLVDIGGLLSASNGPSRLEKGEQPSENTSAQGPDEIGSSAEKEHGKDVEVHEAPALRGRIMRR
ncbi:hypothetical protein C8035_v010591 [Colletotrichum spinosum]|uniref:Uncharacterized protein n=1 Tax=Colletotrichum spinosum TaxID=1347390 RepID=A0A4V3HS50_9PEZI|nr:hypothetical protein C8035_v010591 [Colletotrichum spinosum]